MIDITLTEEEQLMCQEKAKARYNIARKLGLTQLRIDTSPRNVELLGVQGEMAFAKLFSLHTPMVEHGADAGWDYEINGITIDVKTAFKPNHRLLFRELPVFKARVAVLVVKISEDVFRIKGWVSKKNFANWAEPMDDGGFALPNNRLRKIQNLWLNTAIKGLK
jgi:hypothetical protein